MKSKLTFLAVLMAALFVFAGVNQAHASGTRCNSMTIYDAPQYVMAESLMWFWNPAHITLFPPLLSTTWNLTSNVNGSGVLLLNPVPNFYMLISAVGQTNATKFIQTAFEDGGTVFGVSSAAGITAVPGFAYAEGDFTSFGSNYVPEIFNTAPGIALTNVSLTFAYRIGVISVGGEVGVGYTDNIMSDGDAAYKYYEPQVKLGAFIPFSRALNMDVTVHMKFPLLSAEVKDTYAYGSDGVNYDILIGARLNAQIAQMHQLHIWVSYTASDHSTMYENKRTGITEEYNWDRTNHNLVFGFSDEMKFSAYALAFVGFDLTFNVANTEFTADIMGTEIEGIITQKKSDIVGNIRMGGETVIWKTLQFRTGLTHKFLIYSAEANSSTQGDPTRTYNAYMASGTGLNYQSNVGIGFGARLGTVIFEFNLEKTLFTEGPYFLSGNGSDNNGDDFASDVTIIYLLPVQQAAPAASNEEK